MNLDNSLQQSKSSSSSKPTTADFCCDDEDETATAREFPGLYNYSDESTIQSSKSGKKNSVGGGSSKLRMDGATCSSAVDYDSDSSTKKKKDSKKDKGYATLAGESSPDEDEKGSKSPGRVKKLKIKLTKQKTHETAIKPPDPNTTTRPLPFSPASLKKDTTKTPAPKPTTKSSDLKAKLKLKRGSKTSLEEEVVQQQQREDPDLIAKEIKKVEAALEGLHQQMKKKASKKYEDQLWELQRTLTGLKRKLRSVNVLAAGAVRTTSSVGGGSGSTGTPMTTTMMPAAETTMTATMVPAAGTSMTATMVPAAGTSMTATMVPAAGTTTSSTAATCCGTVKDCVVPQQRHSIGSVIMKQEPTSSRTANKTQHQVATEQVQMKITADLEQKKKIEVKPVQEPIQNSPPELEPTTTTSDLIPTTITQFENLKITQDSPPVPLELQSDHPISPLPVQIRRHSSLPNKPTPTQPQTNPVLHLPIFLTDSFTALENTALLLFNQTLQEQIIEEEAAVQKLIEQLSQMIESNQGALLDNVDEIEDYEELVEMLEHVKYENDVLHDQVTNLKSVVAQAKLEEFQLELRLKYLQEHELLESE